MRASGGQRYRYSFGTAEFDEARFELRVDDKPVKVEPKPLEVLLQLLNRMGDAVTREEIRERLWPKLDPADNVMANAIKKLRTALGSNQDLVVTVTRVGYRLAVVPRRVAIGRGYAVQSTAQLRVAIQQAFSELRELDAAIDHGQRAVAATLMAGGPLSELSLAARMQLAADLARGGRHSESAALLDQMRADLSADSASRPLDWSRWWWVKSDLQAFCLELDDSLSSARTACEFLALGEAPDPRLVDGVRTRLGKALRMTGDYKGSERVLLELVAAQAERDGAGAETTQLSRLEVARSFMFQQRTDAALRIALEARDRLMSSLGRYNLATQWANDTIASIRFKMEDYAGAASAWQEVVHDLQVLSARPSDFAVTAQANVVLALLYAGEATLAEAAARRSLELAGTLFDGASPRVQSVRFQLAFCLLEQGKTEEVQDLLEGLDPGALKQAVQAGDWEGRIAYLRGRLALLEGRLEPACAHLDTANRLLAGNAEKSIFAPAKVRGWLARAHEAGRQQST